MKKTLLSILFILSLSLTIAHASNYGFLASSPMGYLTDADYKLMIAAQKTALTRRDGSKVSWSNSKTAASGTITPSNTRQANGLLCKDLTFF